MPENKELSLFYKVPRHLAIEYIYRELEQIFEQNMKLLTMLNLRGFNKLVCAAVCGCYVYHSVPKYLGGTQVL